MEQPKAFQQKLQISYDGPGLTNHEIDAEACASSLLALSQFVKTSYKITHKEDTECQIKITAAKPGSIDVDLTIKILGIAGSVGYVFCVADWKKMCKQFIKNIGFAASTGVSLISFLRSLNKRKIVGVKESNLEYIDLVTLILDDKTEVTCPRDIYMLIMNQAVRESLYNLLKILEGKDVNRIEFKEEDSGQMETVNIIKKDELALFRPDVVEESSTIEEFPVIGTLDRLSLAGDPKSWKLIDKRGKKEYTFTVTDSDFLRAVRRNEIQFVGSDLFRVQMRAITPPPSESKKVKYEGYNVEMITANQANLFNEEK